jgi:hypothetical protein
MDCLAHLAVAIENISRVQRAPRRDPRRKIFGIARLGSEGSRMPLRRVLCAPSIAAWAQERRPSHGAGLWRAGLVTRFRLLRGSESALHFDICATGFFGCREGSEFIR